MPWWVGIPTGIDGETLIPQKFALHQNYPNPFNPVTTIQYALKQKEDVQLILYDILGKKVTTLVDKSQNAGWYSVEFDATNLASGVYIYRLQAGDFVRARKMIVVK